MTSSLLTLSFHCLCWPSSTFSLVSEMCSQIQNSPESELCSKSCSQGTEHCSSGQHHLTDEIFHPPVGISGIVGHQMEAGDEIFSPATVQVCRQMGQRNERNCTLGCRLGEPDQHPGPAEQYSSWPAPNQAVIQRGRNQTPQNQTGPGLCLRDWNSQEESLHHLSTHLSGC